jgi:pimeloyl-ACP methyl ester carboxylesterase
MTSASSSDSYRFGLLDGVDRESRYLTLKGKEIHFLAWIPTAAHRTGRSAEEFNSTAVVMWHGLARNCRDFDYVAPRVAKALGLTVFVPDTLGRGLSQWAPTDADSTRFYCLRFYHEQVAEFLEALKIEKCYWLGTSMGGLVGMNAAGRENTRSKIVSLILNDVGPEVAPEAIKRILQYAAVPLVFNSMSEMKGFIQKAYASFGPAPDEWWTHMAEISSRRLPDGRVTTHYDPRVIQGLATDGAPGTESTNQEHEPSGGAAVRNAEAESLWPGWELYETIRCPTLLVRGGTSDLLLQETAEKMTTVGPKCELRVLPGIGHAPAFNTDEQVDMVIKFFQSACQ